MHISPACMYVYHACLLHTEVRRDQSLWNNSYERMDGCEPPCGQRELNPGPLQV